MAEFCFGMIMDIAFNLAPVSLVVSYLLAPGADREKAAQQLDLGEGVLKLCDESFSLLFRGLSKGDIPGNVDTADYFTCSIGQGGGGHHKPSSQISLFDLDHMGVSIL